MKRLVGFIIVVALAILPSCDIDFYPSALNDRLESPHSKEEASPQQPNNPKPDAGSSTPQTPGTPGTGSGNTQTPASPNPDSESSQQPGDGDKDNEATQNPTSGNDGNPQTPESESGNDSTTQTPSTPNPDAGSGSPQTPGTPGADSGNTQTPGNGSNDGENSVNQGNGVIDYTIKNGVIVASVSLSGSVPSTAQYYWYFGFYTQQDANNLTDDNIMNLYDDRLIDNKPGERVRLLSDGVGHYGLILLVVDQNKIVSKFFKPVAIYTERVFVHNNATTGPDANQNYMYFAVKVKGTSPNGNFRQAVKSGYSYARDLHFQIYSSQVVTDQFINFNGSEVGELYTRFGIYIDGYNDKTGFTNEEGTSLSFPFYFGYDDFRVLMDGSDLLRYDFEVFVIRDTKPQDTGIIGGNGFAHPVFIRMSGSESLSLEIPLKQAGKEYNPSIHRNIALLTLDFSNYDVTTRTPPIITFDGFVEK